MRLLVIEDEDDLRNALVRGFQKLGYSADSAGDGLEGMELLEANSYDLILLDLNLPGIDGLEILSRIREADWEQKVLILSARTAFHQRVQGLDLGANDYLVKPFDFQELEARIRNLLRRQFVQEKPQLVCRGITLNTTTHTVSGPDGRPLEFTPKEFGILEYLMMNRGRPVSAEELMEHVWSDDSDQFSNAVKVHISLIRKKLASVNRENLLETIRGVGYLIEEEEK